MKKQARMLLDKGIDSLVLAVEHFNRPWDRGRKEAVLILLDRSFELILKAAIIHRGGKIREAYERETIGFEKCVRKCLDDANLKFLSVDEGLTVQIINSLRDAAQHDVVELSEQELYLHAQAGVTLFRGILSRVFAEKLSDHVPERVLPVSPNPPPDLHTMIEADFEKIIQQLQRYSRDQVEAKAKLKALAIVESSLSGVRSQPSELEVNALARKVKEGKTWQELFPGISTLRVSAEGDGINVAIRITRRDGDAVHIVPEGTPGATVLAVRKVDQLGFYSLGLHAVAEKVSLSPPRALAVVKELKLQESDDYFKDFKVDSQRFKRYSAKAVEKIKEELPKLDMDAVWERQKPTGRRNR